MRQGLVGLVVLVGCISVSRPARGQTAPAPDPPSTGTSVPMSMSGPLGIDDGRDGSGTSWLPDDTPMSGPMRQVGSWMLMVHGNAFLQDVQTTGTRGLGQLGSVNWFMGMARHDFGGGQLTLRSMLSLDPLTVGKCGYPDLLQSGEVCNGASLHDDQHPHNLFMELATDYRRAISPSFAVEFYAGPVGDPALGPVAFPHRPSAMATPIAPITHHWLDSTHVSFGVVTGAIYGRRWKAEASVFNGREPDDRRLRIELAALDSYSGRLWWLPSSPWALQISAGRLKDAEQRPDGARVNVSRLTASATYHRLVLDRLWATTVAWGQNREAGATTSAFLAETSAEMSPRNLYFGRVEIVGKTPADLALPLPPDDVFTVSKVEAGYTRWLAAGHLLRTGLGGSLGLGLVPTALSPFYGRRTELEFSVFLTVRPR